MEGWHNIMGIFYCIAGKIEPAHENPKILYERLSPSSREGTTPNTTILSTSGVGDYFNQ